VARGGASWTDPTVILATVVMLVAAGAVGAVAYNELGSPAPASGPERTAEGVPVSLPDGTPLPPTPAVVADGFDEPVVAAPTPEEVPELRGCVDEIDWDEDPTLRAASITPEGLTVSYRGLASALRDRQTNLTCHARWDGDAWRVWATWSGGANDEDSIIGELEPVCCLREGIALAGMETAAADGAAWTVQQRDGYWLAYPVGDDQVVHTVWPARAGAEGSPPRMVYIAPDGEPLATHADTEG
jgi:hypothetical protein